MPQDGTNFLVHNAPDYINSDICTPNYVDIFMLIRVTGQRLRPNLPRPRWREAWPHLRAVLQVGLIYFFIMPIANCSSTVHSKVSSLSAAACDESPQNTNCCHEWEPLSITSRYSEPLRLAGSFDLWLMKTNDHVNAIRVEVMSWQPTSNNKKV